MSYPIKNTHEMMEITKDQKLFDDWTTIGFVASVN
jgi:hypothetical protein